MHAALPLASMGSNRLNNAHGTGREEECTGCLAANYLPERSEHCIHCLELNSKLQHTEDALRHARKAAREGLMDMAEQNAKLVAAYVEKKREVKQLQASAKEDRRLWQQRLQRLEHELQANKLHIQALMQQLHGIASKQALGANTGSPEVPSNRNTASSQQQCASCANTTEECSSSAASCSSSGAYSAAGEASCSCGSPRLHATPQDKAANAPAACSPMSDATNTHTIRPTPISKLQPLKQHNSSSSCSTQNLCKPAGRKSAADQENCCPGSVSAAIAASAAAAIATATVQQTSQTSRMQPNADSKQVPPAAAADCSRPRASQEGVSSSTQNEPANQQDADTVQQQQVPAGQQQSAASPKQLQQQQGHDAKPHDPHARLNERLHRSLGSAVAGRAAQQAAAGQQQQQEYDTQQELQQQEHQLKQQQERQQHAQQQRHLQEQQHPQHVDQQQTKEQGMRQQQEQLALLAQQLEAENAELRAAQAQAAALKAKAHRMQEAEQLKQRGNALFQLKKYKEAWQMYCEALAMKLEDDTFNAVLLCNRAAALHCCGQYLEAIVDCCVAAHLDNQYPRALQRRAEAYMAVEDYSSAVADLQRLVQLGSSSGADASARLKDAQHKLRAQGGAGPNYYTVLALQRSCSAADVKAAYRRLALKHHPDKATGPHGKAAAEAVFVLITAANTVLSDPERRAAYDAAHLAIMARRRMSGSSSSAGSQVSTPQHQHQRQQPANSSTSTSSRASSKGVYGNWHQPVPGGFGYAAAAEMAAAKAAAAAAAEAARWRSASSSSGVQQSRYTGSPAGGSSSSSSTASGASYAFHARCI